MKQTPRTEQVRDIIWRQKRRLSMIIFLVIFHQVPIAVRIVIVVKILAILIVPVRGCTPSPHNELWSILKHSKTVHKIPEETNSAAGCTAGQGPREGENLPPASMSSSVASTTSNRQGSEAK